MKLLGRGVKDMRKQCLGLAIVILIIQSISLVSATRPVQIQSRMESAETYTPHFPITILENSDFKAYGFPGDGTAEHPFLIQDLNITSDTRLISISNTDAYFVINNCFLGQMSSASCFYLFSVENGIIENCFFALGNDAIGMYGCHNIAIINNTIVSAYYAGIDSFMGFNNRLANNTIVDNANGIRMSGEDNSAVLHNRIYGNLAGGVQLLNCHNDTVDSNIIGWNSQLVGSPESANAYDNGNSSVWSRNHYSDYSGLGTYDIGGEGNATDSNPIELLDTTAPLMKSAGNVTLPANAEELRCLFIDEYPDFYYVDIGGKTVALGYWFDDSVSVPVSLFHGEDANVTFHLTDGAHNSASFTVHVHILQQVDYTPIVYTVAAVVGVLAFVTVLEIRRRRKS